MSLVTLPYELVSFVVHYLDLSDIYNLSRSCKHFLYLLHEASIAKVLLETKAPETLEARSARASKRYAAELRRLLKRRDAISTLSPYLVAVVGYAHTWIYENGVLCYIRDHELRVLDLHRSAKTEMVVSIRCLLNEALVESRDKTKYRFQLLYCSHDIISCLYIHQMRVRERSTRESWILVFNAKEQRIVTVHQLSTTYKIFVRNNDKFLYFGTHTEIGPQGYKNWIIKAYDIKANKWIDGSLVLTDFLGSDIGTTVCFEILGDHFYGLTNRLDPAVEEKDWTGYYTCFRFPLDPGGFHKLKRVPRESLWRRQHTEGPIDERWSFLRLFKDETTSQLKVIEARKEWLSGQSSAKRTYYTTEIRFQDVLDEASSSKSCFNAPISESQSTTRRDDQLPHEGPPSRDPHMVHVGDDASKCLMFTPSKCPLRSYHSSCQAFIDLVDDPTSLEPGNQRVRIRGSSRRPWTPAELKQRKRLLTEETDPSQHTLTHKIEDIYKHGDIVFWPPDEGSSGPNTALSQLYQILNPPTYSGNIEGVWDERSMLYATGGTSGSLKALVFISWDPAIYLNGVVQYPDSSSLGRAPISHDPETRVSKNLGLVPSALCGKKGKEKQDDSEWCSSLEPNVTQHRDTSTELSTSISTTTANQSQWRVFERPKYRNYELGYHFAHSRS